MVKQIGIISPAHASCKPHGMHTKGPHQEFWNGWKAMRSKVSGTTLSPETAWLKHLRLVEAAAGDLNQKQLLLFHTSLGEPCG